jgi:hypothetical protein
MIYLCVAGCGNSKEFKTTPNPDHPNWPYLCSDCANAPPRKGSKNSSGFVVNTPRGLREVTSIL